MNKFKRLKWLVSCGLLVVVVLVALPIIGAESTHKDITLNSLEARILGNNLEIVRVNEELMIAEYKLDEAEDKKLTAASSSIETNKNNKYYPVEAQMNLDYAKWNQETVKENTLLDGYKAYHGYFLLIDRIEFGQEKLARLEEDLEVLETKIGLGTAALKDKASAEIAIKQASYDLQNLIYQRDSAFLDLNRMMKYDFETELVLEKVEIPYEVYETDGLKDDIARVLRTDGDLKKLEDQLNLVRIELTIYQDHNGSDQYDKTITSKKEESSNLNLDIKDKKLNLEYEVRSTYLSLMTAKDQVQIKSLELENYELALEVVEKRFEVGFETESALKLAQENVDGAQIEIEQAKLDYYLAVQAYKNLVN